MAIQHIISLGTLCHPTRMMQRIHVKNVSYPFDWLFSDENVIIDILNDDFNKFMDKSYYGDVVNKFSERTCGHSLYHEDFFFHKNPRNEDDYLYYQRCINRFKGMLRDPGEKLFIMMYAPGSTKHPTDVYNMFENGSSKEDIIRNLKVRGENLNNTLMNFTNNYKLLVVMNFGDNDKQSFEMDYVGNIHYLTLNTLSESTGVTFKDNMDNLFLSGIMCEHYLR
jgi:hypothetical protein